MLLHQQFVRIAKQYENKVAIVDRTLNRRVTYKKALIGSLIIAKKFQQYSPGFIGIMMPNSAGTILAILGTLMSGRIPVMINYSTGAAANCEFAQKKCAFKTIITSRALCEKINCPHIDGMVYMEDIMKSISLFEKIRAALKAGNSTENLLKKIHPLNIIIRCIKTENNVTFSNFCNRTQYIVVKGISKSITVIRDYFTLR